ncbi:hypothetical protein THRCLA_06112 [Thraustotheca clavata]|uniref:F-box domain-containing protein n=1 Tax=Thraustotheca clavata TaxID=74557 RepID=A0A1V9ZQE7_9STRA|nr:hypothetical protein THRCLA_06112 [Thraustotheca clavata]
MRGTKSLLQSITRGIFNRLPPSHDHVCIVCKDVPKSIRFYEELFGAKQLYKDDENFGDDPAFMKVGSVQIALLPLDPGQIPIKDHNGAHFAISCHEFPAFELIKESLSSDLKRLGSNPHVQYEDYGRQSKVSIWFIFQFAKSGTMLVQLPAECRAVLYAFLEAKELCRLSCTCRLLEDVKGPKAHELWKRLYQRDILNAPRHVPRTCTLERRNAFSDMDNQEEEEENDSFLSFREKLVSARTSCGVDSDEEKKWSIKRMRTLPWPAMYRVCSIKAHQLYNDDARFQEELRLLQEFKRERGRFKELVGNSKKSSDRGIALSCVKYLNKTTRRFLATPNASNNNKAEITAQITSVEEAIKELSSSTFSLRVQLRKDYRKLQAYLLTGKLQMDEEA